MKFLGGIRGADGRPKNCYGTWQPKALEHDYEVTRWCRCYARWPIERGNELEQLADAIVHTRPKLYVELDTGSIPYDRVRERWRRAYADPDGYVVVVTLRRSRLEGLQRAGAMLDKIAVFGVLEEIRQHPFATVYETAAGVPLAVAQLVEE